MPRTLAALAGGAAVALCAAAAPVAATPRTDADVVREWNELAFAAVRSHNAIDAQAARLYAMLNGAMFDAVNGTAAGGAEREPAFLAPDEPVAGDAASAAEGAAHDVLAAVYPDAVGPLAPAQGQAARGRAWGQQVAQAVVAARTGDGSAGNVPQAGDSTEGKFEMSWNNTQFRDLKPFVIADSDAYVGGGPPALTWPQYTTDFNVVKAAGDGRIDDPVAMGTFRFWSLGGRTNQPSGAWLQVAEDVSATERLSLEDTARLFALESFAMADTVAPTYTAKVVYHSWRPTAAIQRANEDGNDDTDRDTGWFSRSVAAGSNAGTSPEHYSGHSAFSTAAAETLAGFFCRDDVAFTLTTDSGGGASRGYESFSAAAVEAGQSRVVGGLHFPFSNVAGASSGRAVAEEVLSKALLRKHGPTHEDGCPR